MSQIDLWTLLTIVIIWNCVLNNSSLCNFLVVNITKNRLQGYVICNLYGLLLCCECY